MALELFGVGVAIAQLLLRAGGSNSAADAAGNALDGWTRFREHQKGRQSPPDALGEAIARRLEARLELPRLTDEQEADMRAAAADVADLIGNMSRNREAVILAAASPDKLMDYFALHGAGRLRSQTSERATPFFDELLKASADQFALLAPSSPLFNSEALIRILKQLEAIEGRLERDQPDTNSVLKRAVAATPRMSGAARKELDPEILPSMDRTGLLSHNRGGLIRGAFPQVILGEGGLGKSVLSGQIYDRHSKDRACILLLCSRLPSSVVLGSAKAIDLALGELASGFEISLRALCNDLPNRPMVIIDTLDLLLREDTADDINTLLQLIEDVADIVVTCREREWLDLIEPSWKARGTRSTLPRLNIQEVLAWARSFMDAVPIGSDKASEFHSSLEAALKARRSLDVLGVPLRLAMACGLYASEGSLPDGLTVTELYGQYWDRRVRRNRRGRLTPSSVEKESVALSIAERVWADSLDRFVEDVPRPVAANAEALRELLSEGVVKETGLRVSFFHQTFAEFAVAKRLAGYAEISDWKRLRDGLEAGRSGYWGVAGHLVMEAMSQSRMNEVLAQIPSDKVEGVRLLLRAIYANEDSNAEKLIQSLRSERAVLLASAADMLGEAPARLVAPASAALLSLLSEATEGITGLVRAIGDLVRASDENEAVQLLSSALKVLSERADRDLELMASEVQRLISHVFPPNSCANRRALIKALVDLYGILPKAGQTALLNLVASSPGSTTTDIALLEVALTFPVPEGGVGDALVLLHREWLRSGGKKTYGWTTYLDFLSRSYPERWDAVQVRLITLLAADPAAASELIAAAVRPTNGGAPHRDRVTNAAKYLADSKPDAVIKEILHSGISPMRDAVGSASQIIRQVDATLTVVQRIGLIRLLKPLVQHDARKAWPAVIKLCIPVDGLLDEQLDELARAAEATPLPGQPSWELVVGVVVDALLQSLSSTQLLAHQNRIEALLAACDGSDHEREAKFYGALTPVSPAAREWVDLQVVDGMRSRTKGLTIGQIVERVDQWEAEDWRAVGLPWFVNLLRVRHEGAVTRLAKCLKKDSAGDAWNAHYTAVVVDRLVAALRDQEDPQVSDNLLTLLAELVHRDGRPQNRPSAVKVQEIFASFDGSLRQTGGRANSNRAALYGQTAKCLTDIAKAVLPEHEFVELVQKLLLDTDADKIAGRSIRVLAGLLTSVVRTYPHAWSKFEDSWPTLSDGNKRAIIECALQGKVSNGTSVALRLARRSDCPTALASQVFRRVAE